MTPLQQAEIDWKKATTSHPKRYRISEFREEYRTHEFRSFQQAIALLNWPEDCIQIEKVEKLPDTGGGAAIPLIDFLKLLSDKYDIRLSCRVKPYTPDPPWSDGERVPSLQKLKTWYENRGFQLDFTPENPYPMAWYPDIPPNTPHKSDNLPVG
jgi:hypothetical protein